MTPSRINKSLPRKERGSNLPPNPRYSWGLSEQSCSAAEVGGVSSSVWRSNLFGFIPPSVIANGASSLPVSSMPLAGQRASIETSERPYSRRGAPMIHQLRIYEISEENKEQAGSGKQRRIGGDCRYRDDRRAHAASLAARPRVRLRAGRPVSQYAGSEGCAGLAGAEPHA